MNDAQLLATIRRMIREERATARAGISQPLVLPGTVTTGGDPPGSVQVRLDGETASHAMFNAVGMTLSENQRVYVTLAPPHGAMVTGIITTGDWLTWVPTVAQGVSTDITKTILFAEYFKVARMVTWDVWVTLTATGTAGSPITVTLPYPAASVGAVIGAGDYYDVGTGVWLAGGVMVNAAANVGIAADGQPGILVGAVAPPGAAAVDDQIRIHGVYRATT